MRRRGAPGRVVRIVAVAVAVAAGLSPPAGAQTSDERGAYAELRSAARDFERSASGGLPAARRVLQAAERAHQAFRQADGRRDAADERYHAAADNARVATITCETRRCNDERIITYPGIGNDYAAGSEARAAMFSANAEYVEAVGEPGAGRMRQDAARERSIANAFRRLNSVDEAEIRRRNALVREEIELIDQDPEIHRRATAAHVAANRAALRALEGAARTVLAAADRMVQRDYPLTGRGAVWRARAALERARGNAVAPGVEDESDRTDAAVEGVMTAMRVTLDVLDRHLQAVDREVTAIEQRYAGPVGGADAGLQEPTGGGAPPPGAGGGSEPPREPTTLREWAGYLVNLLNEVEGYVTAAAQTENSNQCGDVAHAQNIASNRLYNLVGGGRPEFIPADRLALDGLRERERAAQSRVAEICADKPLP